ncbi:hypothetical protein NDU88_005690 [Pleurodeles waltl]|uniref:Uncharacterized protein n=1 Tax=Pleurodeles waltl TaxID=8319 RepID=A0AAV7TCB4_PLEWA|nr:hypothetical protein NDU88_005690 [Pleurodeles waltl]
MEVVDDDVVMAAGDHNVLDFAVDWKTFMDGSAVIDRIVIVDTIDGVVTCSVNSTGTWLVVSEVANEAEEAVDMVTVVVVDDTDTGVTVVDGVVDGDLIDNLSVGGSSKSMSSPEREAEV